MTTERQLSEVILDILVTRPNGEASIADLIHEIPKRITLSQADFAPSPTRPNEAVWEQRVRNITSHKSVSTNFIRLGYLERTDGGLKITTLGRGRPKTRQLV